MQHREACIPYLAIVAKPCIEVESCAVDIRGGKCIVTRGFKLQTRTFEAFGKHCHTHSST